MNKFKIGDRVWYKSIQSGRIYDEETGTVKGVGVYVIKVKWDNVNYSFSYMNYELVLKNKQNHPNTNIFMGN